MVEQPSSVSRTGWRLFTRHAKEQVLHGVILGLTVGVIDCDLQPTGQPCNVRAPLITAVVFVAWLILFSLWAWIWRAPRSVANQALKAKMQALGELASIRAELDATIERSARRRRVREELSSLIIHGDQAWNATCGAFQLWQSEQVDPLRTLGGPAERRGGSLPRSNVPEWWKDVGRWITEVETYLFQTPELGQSYRDLFRAQDMDTNPKPGMPDRGRRLKHDMEFIRVKQARLREFMQEFKD